MTRPMLQALCCNCGTVRRTTDWGGWGECDLDALRRLTEITNKEYPPHRCWVWRKCATCGDRTRHAYVRDDEGKDDAEFDDRRRRQAVIDAGSRIRDDLKAMGVRIYRKDVDDIHEMYVTVTRYLDDGVYVVTIAMPTGVRPAEERLRLYKQVWKFLVEREDLEYRAWSSVWAASEEHPAAAAVSWSIQRH